jgi:hypothetical protein
MCRATCGGCCCIELGAECNALPSFCVRRAMEEKSIRRWQQHTTSHVTRHTPHVTRHTSHVTRPAGDRCEGCADEALLRAGRGGER